MVLMVLGLAKTDRSPALCGEGLCRICVLAADDQPRSWCAVCCQHPLPRVSRALVGLGCGTENDALRLRGGARDWGQTRKARSEPTKGKDERPKDAGAKKKHRNMERNTKSPFAPATRKMSNGEDNRTGRRDENVHFQIPAPKATVLDVGWQLMDDVDTLCGHEKEERQDNEIRVRSNGQPDGGEKEAVQEKNEYGGDSVVRLKGQQEEREGSSLEGIQNKDSQSSGMFQIVEEVQDGRVCESREEQGQVIEGGKDESTEASEEEEVQEGEEGLNEEVEHEEWKPWREQKWPLDLNGILALYHCMNESLGVEMGEYQLSELVRIEDSARVHYAPPKAEPQIVLLNQTLARAKAAAAAAQEPEIVEESAEDCTHKVLVQQRAAANEGVVVRLWGPWSMGIPLSLSRSLVFSLFLSLSLSLFLSV